MNLTEYAAQCGRAVTDSARENRPTKIITIRRDYPASDTELWEALTDPERLPRWFLPISGELEVGGRFQFEGNAGGVVQSCRPASAIDVTWEMGDDLSWLRLRLQSRADGTTELRLEHEVFADTDHWTEYGPGAVGVGWDSGFLGLALHLETGEAVAQQEGATMLATPAGRDFVRFSATDWTRAAVAAGESSDVARAAGERTIQAYTWPDPSADSNPDEQIEPTEGR